MPKIRIGWMLLAGVLAVLPASAQSDNQAALAKDGTPTAAVINSLQSAVNTAGFDAGDFGSAYHKYQDTRGPALAAAGFNVNSFLGKGLLSLVRLGFMAALLITFVTVAVSAVKGKASLADLGWALAKTFLGVLIFLQAGMIYALVVTFPVLVGKLITNATNPQPGAGLIQVMAGDAVTDGVGSAQAYIAGTLQALSAQQHDNQVKGLLEASTKLNAWMKVTGVMNDAADLVQIPKVDPNSKARPLDDAAEIRLLQSIQHSTQLWAARWPSWKFTDPQSPEQAQNLKMLVVNAYEDARNQMGTDSADANAQAADRNALRYKVYQGVKAEFDKNVIDPLSCYQAGTSTQTVVDASGVPMVVSLPTGPSSAEVKRGGEVASKRFLDAAKEETGSTLGRVAKWFMHFITDYWMHGILAGLCFIWLWMIELFLLQFTIMLPLWIHPKTEASAAKGLRLLVMTACFLPVYLPILEVFDRLMGFKSVALMLMFGPLALLITPLAAAGVTIYVLKNVMTGLNFVGGIIKGTMSGLATVAVAATPVGRMAAIAGGAALGKAAEGREALAQAPGISAAAAARHRATARLMRGAAGAVDYAQETAGKIFGVDEKYIDRGNTVQQNLRGARAVQRTALTAGLAAALHGEGATGVFNRMEKAGEEHRKDAEARESRNAPASSDAVDAQKAAAQELTRAVRELADAVRAPPPRPDNLASLPPAPVAAAARRAEVLPQTAGMPPERDFVPPPHREETGRDLNESAPQSSPAVTSARPPAPAPVPLAASGRKAGE